MMGKNLAVRDMRAEGEDCWNGVGGVGDTSQREDGWGDREEFSSSREVRGMSR